MKKIALIVSLTAVISSAMSSFAMDVSADQSKQYELKSVLVDGVTMKVEYLSAELATEQGRDEVQRRIVSAAKKVCGNASSLHMITNHKQCIKDLVHEAKDKVVNRQLLASDS